MELVLFHIWWTFFMNKTGNLSWLIDVWPHKNSYEFMMMNDDLWINKINYSSRSDYNLIVIFCRETWLIELHFSSPVSNFHTPFVFILLFIWSNPSDDITSTPLLFGWCDIRHIDPVILWISKAKLDNFLVCQLRICPLDPIIMWRGMVIIIIVTDVVKNSCTYINNHAKWY